MKHFDEENATSDELYDWCIKEYKSNNPITRFLLSRYYEVIEQILKQIKPNISNVLEIGCGAGESTMRLKKSLEGIKYDATDKDIRYIEAVNNRELPIIITKENVYKINRNNNSYDCIIMLEVLEHLEDVYLALSELFRVSSRYVIISVPNEPLWRIGNFIRGKYLGDFGNTPGHINHFNRRTLIQTLSPFNVKVFFYFPFPWIIFTAEKNNVNR